MTGEEILGLMRANKKAAATVERQGTSLAVCDCDDLLDPTHVHNARVRSLLATIDSFSSEKMVIFGILLFFSRIFFVFNFSFILLAFFTPFARSFLFCAV